MRTRGNPAENENEMNDQNQQTTEEKRLEDNRQKGEICDKQQVLIEQELEQAKNEVVFATRAEEGATVVLEAVKAFIEAESQKDLAVEDILRIFHNIQAICINKRDAFTRTKIQAEGIVSALEGVVEEIRKEASGFRAKARGIEKMEERTDDLQQRREMSQE